MVSVDFCLFCVQDAEGEKSKKLLLWQQVSHYLLCLLLQAGNVCIDIADDEIYVYKYPRRQAEETARRTLILSSDELIILYFPQVCG